MIVVRGNKILHTTCGRVLVKLSKPEEKTSSGLIIPKQAQELTDFVGEVVLVGKTDDLNKVGDKVIVRKHAGIKVETDDSQDYRMYDRNELLWNLTQNPVR